MNEARFSIGQCVEHRLFDYRGVVVDVDATFQGSDELYQQIALTQPPRNEPWYRVLVHDSGRETYVAERNLVTDDSNEPVNHPLLHRFFKVYSHGHYSTGRLVN